MHHAPVPTDVDLPERSPDDDDGLGDRGRDGDPGVQPHDSDGAPDGDFAGDTNFPGDRVGGDDPPPVLQTDPGLVWIDERFEKFVNNQVTENWQTWFVGAGTPEWMKTGGEEGSAQALKKTNVQVGLFRQNRGFVAGDRYRIHCPVRLKRIS